MGGFEGALLEALAQVPSFFLLALGGPFFSRFPFPLTTADNQVLCFLRSVFPTTPMVFSPSAVESKNPSTFVEN